MNLEQFLEEEHKDFVNIPDLDDYLCTSVSNIDEWIEKHDTRLINFVLDKVKEEVEKQRVDYRKDYKHMDDLTKFIKQTEERTNNFLIDDTSTIIDNLKIK